ncbi:hypothetical protein RJ639_041930 [Escallonia herrerae]|uniref:BHLH domain-containing protein n=1 Tax=Escallonia herrerae TaxID=1293975 RepID=A0AA88WGG2_9ASTE|nr:hypothetical protein RJ639_041930 [Escallonia herrerae]
MHEHLLMDSIFLLSNADRAAYLQHMMNTFSCSYICLWSYFLLPSPYLFFMDGRYIEGDNQPSSSSSGSLAQRLFDEYRSSIFMLLDNGRVPGLAFSNNLPYLELKEQNLQRLVSNQAQLQFYQAAVFMGCKTGEIELGMTSDAQVNLETELRNWFPEDFAQQALPRELSQPTDQNRPSSSSSSLRSLSMGSPEPSSFLFNIPSTSYIQEAQIEQALRPTSTTTRIIISSPVQQAIQALSQIRNVQFPTIEGEDAAMTRAMLTVISSSSSPSSSSSSQSQRSQKASAFKSYRSTSALAPITPMTTRARRENMLKRSIAFLSTLNLMRNHGQIQGTRPTSTQLHHMISERRRREKLNESFQALRSLLPPGSKRDKASVLSSTTEYMSSLKAQVAELSRRNLILEAQLPRKEAVDQGSSGSSSERSNVQVTHVAESTSEARIVDLRVSVRGVRGSMLDLVIRVLEFLKQVKNVTLVSVDAETQMLEANSMNRVTLRLQIEGVEWDETAFQEAVRRVVDDLAQ